MDLAASRRWVLMLKQIADMQMEVTRRKLRAVARGLQ